MIVFRKRRKRTYEERDVSTLDAVAIARNDMASKVYPLSMDDCEVVGLNWGCGESCPVLKAGNCSNPPTEEDNDPPKDIISACESADEVPNIVLDGRQAPDHPPLAIDGNVNNDGARP